MGNNLNPAIQLKELSSSSRSCHQTSTCLQDNIQLHRHLRSIFHNNTLKINIKWFQINTSRYHKHQEELKKDNKVYLKSNIPWLLFLLLSNMGCFQRVQTNLALKGYQMIWTTMWQHPLKEKAIAAVSYWITSHRITCTIKLLKGSNLHYLRGHQVTPKLRKQSEKRTNSLLNLL